MITAMQELIEIYEYYHSFEEFNEWFMDMGKKAMLEKEKEQIKESFEDGISEATNEQHGKLDYNMDAEEYYNQTYNQNN